jgi:hypothetical protein
MPANRVRGQDLIRPMRRTVPFYGWQSIVLSRDLAQDGDFFDLVPLAVFLPAVLLCVSLICVDQ